VWALIIKRNLPKSVFIWLKSKFKTDLVSIRHLI